MHLQETRPYHYNRGCLHSSFGRVNPRLSCLTRIQMAVVAKLRPLKARGSAVLRARSRERLFANGVLTMYRPNFCLECGHKLLRLRWNLWTSRKFCNGCARRLRKQRLIPLLITTSVLFGVGYVAGRARRAVPPPLIIERRSDSPLNDNEPTKESSAAAAASDSGSTRTQTATPVSAVDGPVYICGARTKKGTPCSRRVHGPVRCWQHKGMPSIIPAVPIEH